ncbi:hypothetical protein BD289DRAFT_432031 [Coniella lustricola]|uniref:Uncharacterized protein n=1 Tax=Coniella lustricola TaxID=2025994 RepID=A0A2T3AA60_9PEZI|nr:hypothetical protein BD289DRAFT_432031 [Coniella lustricola]
MATANEAGFSTRKSTRPRNYTPMQYPRTASWNVPISSTDRAKMLHGFWPLDMDDKWVVFAEVQAQGASATTTTATLNKASGTGAGAGDGAGVSTEDTTDGETSENANEDSDSGGSSTANSLAASSSSANFILRFCRSWTGDEHVILMVESDHIEADESERCGSRISKVEWERGAAWLGPDASKDEEEPEIKAMMWRFCRGLLGCEMEALTAIMANDGSE